MTASRPRGDDLGGWLAANGFEPADGPGTIADVALVRSLLIAAELVVPRGSKDPIRAEAPLPARFGDWAL